MASLILRLLIVSFLFFPTQAKASLEDVGFITSPLVEEFFQKFLNTFESKNSKPFKSFAKNHLEDTLVLKFSGTRTAPDNKIEKIDLILSEKDTSDFKELRGFMTTDLTIDRTHIAFDSKTAAGRLTLASFGATEFTSLEEKEAWLKQQSIFATGSKADCVYRLSAAKDRTLRLTKFECEIDSRQLDLK